MKNEKPYVLLVEDNAADANLVEEALAEANLECELSILRNGAQAIDFIERLDSDSAQPYPDLLLLDLNLPKVGGEAVLKRVRMSPRHPSVKVVIISSSNALPDRERVMQLGASAYFHKPSDLAQFMELGPKVKAVLEETAEGG